MPVTPRTHVDLALTRVCEQFKDASSTGVTGHVGGVSYKTLVAAVVPPVVVAPTIVGHSSLALRRLCEQFKNINTSSAPGTGDLSGGLDGALDMPLGG